MLYLYLLLKMTYKIKYWNLYQS